MSSCIFVIVVIPCDDCWYPVYTLAVPSFVLRTCMPSSLSWSSSLSSLVLFARPCCHLLSLSLSLYWLLIVIVDCCCSLIVIFCVVHKIRSPHTRCPCLSLFLVTVVITHHHLHCVTVCLVIVPRPLMISLYLIVLIDVVPRTSNLIVALAYMSWWSPLSSVFFVSRPCWFPSYTVSYDYCIIIFTIYDYCIIYTPRFLLFALYHVGVLEDVFWSGILARWSIGYGVATC